MGGGAFQAEAAQQQTDPHGSVADIEQEYYEKSIKYMIYGDILRNGTYPISVSSERIFQAIANNFFPVDIKSLSH